MLHLMFLVQILQLVVRKATWDIYLEGVELSESIVCLIALNKSLLPKTMNFKILDKECAGIRVLGENMNKDITIAMSNNFAFGGINTSLILKKYEG